MTPQIARIVRTEYRTSQDLLEAIADALAIARVAARRLLSNYTPSPKTGRLGSYQCSATRFRRRPREARQPHRPGDRHLGGKGVVPGLPARRSRPLGRYRRRAVWRRLNLLSSNHES